MSRIVCRLFLIAAAALATSAAQSVAQTTLDLATEEQDLSAFDPARPAVRFTVGAGASYTPDYFGSDEYSFGPSGVLRFDYVRLPGGFEFGSSGAAGFLRGFGPRGTARYIAERNANDHSELRGLDNVDASLELGLGLGYDAEYWRAYGDLSYGFIGHHSWVGEFGADAILRPNDAWVVNFGPRAYWGSSRFMDTYFGVSEAETNRNRSTFDNAYSPSSGFYSAGVELGARYSFSEHWGVEGKATYERLINDAADSPIVERGTNNQYGVQVLITRSLGLGF
ncbi:MipA/OmpV family protein [Amaricoccus sp.]|uniref:MipA/OmpV family protein n=1 Tax=Amaricoccus sp. TaxID=1872485 RepID=UPI001B49FD4F|nr:MipA/OmpV family protein [Amaricoccus sp.]MBP7241415.1 MipA/OmpV family protein [Amaricoccus sp.]